MKHNDKKIIGITGGIASGKSTVSKIIKDMGFYLIDADKIARQVVEQSQVGYRDIVNYFGRDILDENLDLDRQKLSDIVFNNKEKRKKLNEITHPLIYKEIKSRIDESRENLIFLDIPLLFETIDTIKEYKIDMDQIWLVYLDKNRQIDRLMKRDKIGEKEAKKKIGAQMDLEAKKTLTNYIIDNNGSKDSLSWQLRELIENLKI